MAGEIDASLTWGAQLAYGERILAEAGSPEPRQEAAELLSRLLGRPAPLLDERPATPMRAADARRYASWVARRAGGVPIPYITGRLEFMGLGITVRWDSPLAPPGAQLLVETALQWARKPYAGRTTSRRDGRGLRRHYFGAGRARAAFQPHLRGGGVASGAGGGAREWGALSVESGHYVD